MALRSQQIGLATSRDLLTWTRCTGNPVLEAGPTWLELLDREIRLATVAAVVLGSQLGSRMMAEHMQFTGIKRVFGLVLLGAAALILIKAVLLN